MFGFSYACGHFLTFAGINFIEPVLRRLGNVFAAIPKFPMKRITSSSEIQKAVVESSTSKLFIEEIRKCKMGLASMKLETANEIRNLALGIEGVDKALTHRFTFLGLFNLTVATALVITVISWSAASLLNVYFPSILSSCSIGIELSVRSWNWLFPVLIVMFSVGLIERHSRFYGISFRVPVSEALSKILLKNNMGDIHQEATKTKVVPVIYLAGGFKSGWQDRFNSVFGNDVKSLDPRLHKIIDPKNYTSCDLAGIQACDIVFAYLENSNPAGYALALEIGYAKAMGKIIIFVDEKSKEIGEKSRYFDMVKASSDYFSEDIEVGYQFLREHLNMVDRKNDR